MRARAAFFTVACLILSILSGCSGGDLPSAPTPEAATTSIVAQASPAKPTSAPTIAATSAPQPTDTERPRSTNTPRLAPTATHGKSIIPFSTATSAQPTEVFPVDTPTSEPIFPIDTPTAESIFPTDTTEPIKEATRAPLRSTPTRLAPDESPTVTGTDFDFLNQNDYVDSLGDAVVVGLIRYTGDTTIGNIEIAVDLEDGNHKLLDTQSADIVPDIVPPNGLIPFSATFPNPPSDYEFYDTTVQGVDADSLTLSEYTADFEVSGEDLLPGADSSTPKLVGKVKNTGSSSAQDPEVIAAILADDGTVLDVNWAYTTLSNVDPGQQTSFEIEFQNGDDATDYQAIVSAEIAP